MSAIVIGENESDIQDHLSSLHHWFIEQTNWQPA